MWVGVRGRLAILATKPAFAIAEIAAKSANRVRFSALYSLRRWLEPLTNLPTNTLFGNLGGGSPPSTKLPTLPKKSHGQMRNVTKIALSQLQQHQQHHKISSPPPPHSTRFGLLIGDSLIQHPLCLIRILFKNHAQFRRLDDADGKIQP